jgi:hypothetical protein
MAEVTVDVDLYDFDTEDLVEELESRGYVCERGYRTQEDEPVEVIAEKVYWQIRDGLEVTPEIRAVIASLTGRIL